GGVEPGLPGLTPRARLGIRPRGAALHPRGQGRDLVVLQLPGRRHLDVAVVADHPDDGAAGRVARLEDRAGVAALERLGPRVEPQPALLLLRTVALHAPARQNRPDLVLEELVVDRRVGRPHRT